MLMPGKPCPGNNTCCNRPEFDRAMYPCALVDVLRARIAGLERQLATVVDREREACAAVADVHAKLTASNDYERGWYERGWCRAAFVIANAIRSRTTKEQEGQTP